MTFLFALWGNVQQLFAGSAAVCGLATIVVVVARAMMRGTAADRNDGRWRYPTLYRNSPMEELPSLWPPIATRLVVAAATCAAVACLPSANDLWRARIALLKYEIAAPENVKSGAAEIERIARKLECKYLGCDEKKP